VVVIAAQELDVETSPQQAGIGGNSSGKFVLYRGHPFSTYEWEWEIYNLYPKFLFTS
jgi:hypothetical protein